jgi:hypothetical protein
LAYANLGWTDEWQKTALLEFPLVGPKVFADEDKAALQQVLAPTWSRPKTNDVCGGAAVVVASALS